MSFQGRHQERKALITFALGSRARKEAGLIIKTGNAFVRKEGRASTADEEGGIGGCGNRKKIRQESTRPLSKGQKGEVRDGLHSQREIPAMPNAGIK